MKETRKERHVKHSFGAVCGKDCRVLILGSVPSVLSEKYGFYYMHPQNRFWKVVGAVLNEELSEATPEEKAVALIRHGVALYDAVEECDVAGSADSSVKNVIPADIPGLISKTDIRAILCNGTKAYATLLKYHPSLAGITKLLPSTSPANASYSRDRLIAEWKSALQPYIR